MYYKIINRKKKIATQIADTLGYALWLPTLFFRNKTIPEKEIKEILVVRTAYIGDVIMTLPLLKPLKQLYPKAKITFLTSNGAKDLFKNNPYVDYVITYDAFWFYPNSDKKDYAAFLKEFRKKRYDLVIEARADIRDIIFTTYLGRARYRVSYKVGGGGFLLTNSVPFKEVKHKVEYHLDMARHLGAQVDSVDWGLNSTKEENRKAEEILSTAKGQITIAMHPGGRKSLKCWVPARYAQVADRLVSEFGARVFFTGAPNEKELIDGIIRQMKNTAVNLAGKTDMRTLAAFIGKLDLFITNDSAPLHIASAMKTPTVAIFGPSKSNETGPYGNIHKVVEKDFPCRYTCDEDVCNHKPFNECMEVITSEDVFSAAKTVLKEKEKVKSGYGIQA